MNVKHDLIDRVNSENIWDTDPVFCFTSDMDWASEAVLDRFFEKISPQELKCTLFVTNTSGRIRGSGCDLGIHPNFLPASSHGESFAEVINACLQMVPGAEATRSHRAFDVTDTSHLQVKHGLKYSSNCITVLQQGIKPILHESGLINFPVFFEEGTHLYNQLGLDFKDYKKYFESPGIKIISFHPMHMVFNSPSFTFMRQMKDSLSRREYSDITYETIDSNKNRKQGIADLVMDVIEWAQSKKIMSLKELYDSI